MRPESTRKYIVDILQSLHLDIPSEQIFLFEKKKFYSKVTMEDYCRCKLESRVEILNQQSLLHSSLSVLSIGDAIWDIVNVPTHHIQSEIQFKASILVVP